MLSLLMECTVLMLKILYELFQAQRITYREFSEYTKVKIEFLKNNIDQINSEIERNTAEDILKKCSLMMFHYGNTQNYMLNSNIVH